MIDPNGIWFWKQYGKKAVIHLVNDLYRYRVHDIKTGKMEVEGNRATLADAKKAVFDHLEDKEEYVLKIGDLVKIRGDKRWNYSIDKCCYTPDQLVDGKYIKHTGHGGVWTGHIDKIQGDMIRVGGGWWNEHLVEVV